MKEANVKAIASKYNFRTEDGDNYALNLEEVTLESCKGISGAWTAMNLGWGVARTDLQTYFSKGRVTIVMTMTVKDIMIDPKVMWNMEVYNGKEKVGVALIKDSQWDLVRFLKRIQIEELCRSITDFDLAHNTVERMKFSEDTEVEFWARDLRSTGTVRIEVKIDEWVAVVHFQYTLNDETLQDIVNEAKEAMIRKIKRNYLI